MFYGTAPLVPGGKGHQRALHLAVDAVGAKHSGAASVLQAVIAAALECQAVGQVTAFLSAPSLLEFELPTSRRLRLVHCRHAEQPMGRIAWLFVGLPAKVAGAGADVLLALNGAGLAPPGIPGYSFVQQSLYFSEEAMAQLGPSARIRVRAIAGATKASCQRAGRVGVQTATMKECVIREFGWRQPRTRGGFRAGRNPAVPRD